MLFTPWREIPMRARPVRTFLLAVILSLTMPLFLVAQAAREQASPLPTGPRSQGQSPGPSSILPPDTSSPPLTPRQRSQLLKSNYRQMKQDADELAGLAQSLRDDLATSNQNVLSLQIVGKAGRIEKLAKRIKSEAAR